MAFFTYLIPADGVYPGKTISFLPDGAVHQAKAANSSLVFADKYEFHDFDQMCEALFTMVDKAEGFIVRGEVAATHIGTKKAFRRKVGKLGDGGVFWRYDPQWVCLDVDGVLKPASIDPVERPEEAIQFVLESLPPYFHDVSCWWQWSSTQSLIGNTEVLKCHLFYMLTNPIPEVKLKEWAKSNHQKHKIDPAVMGSNQPIYILPPNIKGARDWLPARCGLYRGNQDVLDLNLFTSRKFNRDSKITPIDQKKILAKHLHNAGDGGEGEGFNEPIKSAIGAVLKKCGTEIDREKLKEDIRAIIEGVPEDDRRSGRSKDEYMSDAYLDPLIDALTIREGESKQQSYNQYQAARDRYVYITNINRFYDTISGNYIIKDALNMASSRIGRSLADVFVNDDDFTIVDQLTYFPGRDRICAEIAMETGETSNCYNIYRAPNVKIESSAAAKFFIDHVRKLAGDESVFRHMMDWMAFNVQRPGMKIMYAMLIQGKQGTGKSALMEAMKACLGEQNVRPIETHELLGNFTSWMRGKCMAVVEEIRDPNDRFSIYNRLKPLITAPTITLNEKNIPQVTMRNRMNVMAFTNYETAVPMDDDDRRFFVHFSPMEPESAEYYDKLFEVIYKHPGAVRQAFCEWDVGNFNPNNRAPMTESKKFLQEHAGPPLQRILREAYEAGDWPLKYDLVSPRDVAEALAHRIKVSEMMVMVALRRYAPVDMGRHWVEGGKRRMYAIRNHNNWAGKADDLQAVKDYYKRPYYEPMSKAEGYIGEMTNDAPEY